MPGLRPFFFTAPPTTEIYTLSLHDALPIYCRIIGVSAPPTSANNATPEPVVGRRRRSEEHTSEFQSPDHLVCRLLLEKKKGGDCVVPPGGHCLVFPCLTQSLPVDLLVGCTA